MRQYADEYVLPIQTLPSYKDINSTTRNTIEFNSTINHKVTIKIHKNSKMSFSYSEIVYLLVCGLRRHFDISFFHSNLTVGLWERSMKAVLPQIIIIMVSNKPLFIYDFFFRLDNWRYFRISRKEGQRRWSNESSCNAEVKKKRLISNTIFITKKLLSNLSYLIWSHVFYFLPLRNWCHPKKHKSQYNKIRQNSFWIIMFNKISSSNKMEKSK